MRLATRARELNRLSLADYRSRLTFARLDECLRIRHAKTQRRSDATGEFVVHPRALDRRPVRVRRGTADATVVWDTFVGLYHLAPGTVPRDAKRIWDLGSNIGLTVAHYAVLFPNATITGVELDPTTAARAEEHVRPWADRCSILTGAVWFEDGTVSFGSSRGREHITRVGEGDDHASAFSLNKLLQSDDWVDFVKMDIEGAEADVLQRNVEWTEKVGAIKVETHAPYTRDDCMRDLRNLGFQVALDTSHWASVIAVRDPSPTRG
jgi:FkbM family methyltransferase